MAPTLSSPLHGCPGLPGPQASGELPGQAQSSPAASQGWEAAETRPVAPMAWPLFPVSPARVSEG